MLGGPSLQLILDGVPLTLTMFVCMVKRVLSWFDLLVHHEDEPWNAASNQKISAEFVEALLNQA